MILLRQILNYIRHHRGTFYGPANDELINNFKQYILHQHKKNVHFDIIENIRKSLFNNYQVIDETDFGAGTKRSVKKRTVANFARTAVIPKRSGRLLYLLSKYYKPETIIELGTGLGIGTMYLSMGHPETQVITVEGNPSLSKIAAENFGKAGIKNIRIINGKFDEVLPAVLSEVNKKAIVFIDGNHTYKATVKYYKEFVSIQEFKGIIIIDDINWSKEMMKAWSAIRNINQNAVYFDIFYTGMAFIGLADVSTKPSGNL